MRSVLARLALLLVPASVALGVVVACPTVVDVATPPDAGPALDGGPFDDPFGEGEGEGDPGEGEGEGEGDAGEGEGEGDDGGLAPGRSTLAVPVGIEQRSVELVVPDAVRAQPLPLLIVLHGNGDTPSTFLQTTGLANLGEDVVVAAPAGVVRDVVFENQTVPGVSWDAYNELAANPDLQFLDVLVLRLVATGDIDARRVHVLGYSQGGFLAFRYAIDRADRVASAVVISAGDPLNDGGARIRDATRDVPFRLRCGENDPLLPVAQSTTNNLVAFGGDAALTVVPGAGHAPLPVASGETTAGVVHDLVRFQLARALP